MKKCLRCGKAISEEIAERFSLCDNCYKEFFLWSVDHLEFLTKKSKVNTLELWLKEERRK